MSRRLATGEVEAALRNLQRRALELDLEAFAGRIALVAVALGETRGELARGTR